MLIPMLVAIGVWYFGTGAVVLANRRAPASYLGILTASLVLVGAAVAGVEASRTVATVPGAYLAFGSSFVLWAWLEMSYLMGFVTGPEKEPCPVELRSWRRFWRGVRVSLYHELMVVGTGVLLVAACWNAANTVAVWTFVTLWIMRWSAKLNLFLGVANMDLGLLPGHMQYLGSYMATKPMNPLFPVSVTVGAVLCGVHLLAAGYGGSAFDRVAWSLLGTITALAVLEHWLLVLPLKDSRLWRWALQ